MAAPGEQGSIFGPTHDRVTFTAYFLGAIVPLVALVVLSQRYVLPTLTDSSATLGVLGLLVSISVLTLGSFFALRRSTLRSLQRMDEDNLRLDSLLNASSGLANALHGDDAATTTAHCALTLTGARASFILLREGPESPIALVEGAGDDVDKLKQQLVEPVSELADLVIGSGRPLIRGSEESTAVPVAAAVAVPLTADRGSVGAIVAIHTDAELRFENVHLDALSTLAGLASVALRNADLRDAQRNFFSHVTEIIVAALDAYLGYHAGHGDRVAQYANRIGREMGLDDQSLQRLHFASLLHDIGLLRFDRSTQKNPRSCEKHARLGSRMLGRIRLWKEIAPIVHHHHERWDGDGYPDRLSGKAIPLESRIIAVCDAFDTITSNTSYRVAMPLADAVREIEDNAASQFDPEVARTLCTLVESGAIEPPSSDE